jgi:hypothetical protein
MGHVSIAANPKMSPEIKNDLVVERDKETCANLEPIGTRSANMLTLKVPPLIEKRSTNEITSLSSVKPLPLDVDQCVMNTSKE